MNMPIPAMIGLFLILLIVVLLIIRRTAGGRNNDNPGKGVHGTHVGGDHHV